MPLIPCLPMKPPNPTSPLTPDNPLSPYKPTAGMTKYLHNNNAHARSRYNKT